MSELAKNIKKMREKYGYSQIELSRRVGCSKSAISMYENGNREPDLETLEALCDVFNVDINYLTGVSPTTSVIPDIDFFLNDEERQIIIEYRKKDTIDKEMIRRLLNLTQKLQKPNEEE